MRYDNVQLLAKWRADFPDGSRLCNEKYKLFCDAFEIKGFSDASYAIICNSASCFSRMLVTKPPFRMRYDEAMCVEHDCMDDFQALLFDHTYMFKTKDNVPMLVSFPYSDWDLSVNAMRKLQKKFPVTKGIEMYLSNDKIKFIENGDIMLIFAFWMYGRRMFTKFLKEDDDLIVKAFGDGRHYIDGRILRERFQMQSNQENDIRENTGKTIKRK